jgi:threonylcarbamoyladenosine tRNA methylthiotransferase MtaB
LHVFTYSERERTDAAHYHDRVPLRVRKERTARLRQLGENKRRDFYQSNVGARLTVLVESYDVAAGGWVGYSENYCRVVVPDATEGEAVEVEIERFDGELLRAAAHSTRPSQPHYIALPVVA